MSMFLKIPVDQPSASNQLSQADVTTVSGAEASAYGHWSFGPDSSSLTGIGDGSVLTLQSSAPTYSSTNLSIDAGNALLTGLADAADQSFTMCMVMRKPSSTGGVAMICGNLETGLASGRSLWIGSGSQYLTYRGNNTNFSSTLIMTNDTWQFVAISHDTSSTTDNIAIYGGGVSAQTFSEDMVSYPVGITNIALGDPNYNSSGKTLDFAEAVLFDRALSATEMAAVYARAQTRMTARGLSITAFY